MTDHPTPYGDPARHAEPAPYAEPTPYTDPYAQPAQYDTQAPYYEPVAPGTAQPAAPAYEPAVTYGDPVQYGEPVPPPPPAPPNFDQGVDGGDDASVKDKAADTAEAGKQAASEVAQTATDKAKGVADETKAQARNILGEAQGQLREQTQAQHQNLITNLRSLGDELNSMAQGSEQPGPATDLVSQAGSRAHSAASWLDEREPAQLVDEVRAFARRRPAAFIVGALAAGVVAGRLTRGAVAARQDDSDADAPQVGGAS